MQLEQNLRMSMEILQEARKRLNRQMVSPERQILHQLKGQSPGRLQCPFCLYVDARGKGMSARIFDNGAFKCFACGKFGRIENE